MSYPYRGSSKDLKSPPGPFPSSEPPHLGEHDAYGTSQESSTRSVSSFSSSRSALESYCSQRSSTVESALTLLASCGLDPEDLSLLAGMPDNLITVETLPHLLMEIKEKKAGSQSAQSVSSNAPPKDTCQGRIDFCPDANPPLRPLYPPSGEQTENWQDQCPPPSQSSFLPQEPLNSKSSYVGDYNYGHSRDEQGRSHERPSNSMRTGDGGDRTSDYHSGDRSIRAASGWNTAKYCGKDNVPREGGTHQDVDRAARVGNTLERLDNYQDVDRAVRADNSHEHLVDYRDVDRAARAGNSRERLVKYRDVDRATRAGNSRECLVKYQDVDRATRAGNSRECLVKYQDVDRATRAGNSHEHLDDYQDVDRNVRARNSRESLVDYRDVDRAARAGNGRERLVNYRDVDRATRTGHSRERLVDYQDTDRATRAGNSHESLVDYRDIDRATRAGNSRESLVHYRDVDRAAVAGNSREHLVNYQDVDRAARVGNHRERLVDHQDVDRAARAGNSRGRLVNYQNEDRVSREGNSRERFVNYQDVDRAGRVGNSCERLVDYHVVDRTSTMGNSCEHNFDYQNVERASRVGSSREHLVDYKSLDRNRRAGIHREPSTDQRSLEGSTRAVYVQESSTDHWEVERDRTLAMSNTKKVDILPRHPSKQEADEFHGVMPQAFPYACSLCDIVMLSERDWTSHINGSQHADSQLKLLQMYPDWDCRSDSAKGGQRQLGAKREVDTAERNRHGSAQLPAARPISGEKWRSGKDEERSKVIRVKFPPDAVDESYLMKLVQPFGSVVNVSVFPTKAFLEMKTFHQAEDIVKFFTKNPAMVHGSQVQFNLSTTYTFSQSSRVVCFSRLPPGKEKNAELIAMAKRFGQVKHSLFLPNRVFVEMTNKDDADKLVVHYTSHPLKMKGKNVLVTYSTEYSTLKEESPDTNSEGSERLNSYCGRRSPSPRRKSTEMEDSSKPPDITTELPLLSKAETPPDSVKETPLEIQGNDSDIVKSEGCLDAGSSPSPDRNQGCREGNWEGHSDLDSDIEGMEVIGEDEEEGIPDEVLLELEGRNSVEEAEPKGECREDVKVCPVETKSSDFQPEDKLTTEVTALSYESPELQTKDSSDAPTASGMPAHVEIAIEEEEPGVPESLEQCITLDELEEEDDEELGKDSVSMHDSEEAAEETAKDEAEEYFSGRVIYIKNLPKTYYTDSQFVKIVKGFGKVKRYFLIRTRQEGFIEMETHEEAQRAVKELVLRRTEIRGCPLVFQLSRKYLTLTRGWSPEPDCEEEGESRTEQRMTGYSGSPSKSTGIQEELPAKRPCIRKEEEGKEEGRNQQLPQQQHQLPQQQQQRGSSQKEVNLIAEDSETKAIQPSDCLDGGRDMRQIPSPKSPITQARDRPEGEGHATEDKAKDKPEPTAEPAVDRFVPYQPHTPLGQEFVHPVVCYICRLCNAIYTSEDEAKNEHCSSRSHYEKLKVHLERGTTSGLPLNMEKLPE